MPTPSSAVSYSRVEVNSGPGLMGGRAENFRGKWLKCIESKSERQALAQRIIQSGSRANSQEQCANVDLKSALVSTAVQSEIKIHGETRA